MTASINPVKTIDLCIHHKFTNYMIGENILVEVVIKCYASVDDTMYIMCRLCSIDLMEMRKTICVHVLSNVLHHKGVL